MISDDFYNQKFIFYNRQVFRLIVGYFRNKILFYLLQIIPSYLFNEVEKTKLHRKKIKLSVLQSVQFFHFGLYIAFSYLHFTNYIYSFLDLCGRVNQ